MDLAHAPRPEPGKQPVPAHSAVLCVVRHALSWCLLAAALAPSAVVAQVPEPRILVVRSPEPARARPVAERVRARWSARGVDVRVPAPVDEDPDEAAPIEEARRAYQDLRPDAARELLEAWLVRADDTGGFGLDRATLLDGFVWLALARSALSDSDGADRALDRALAIDPMLALDEATYAPHVRERLEARRALRVASQSTLTVVLARSGVETETEAGAEIRVDGEIVGAPPLELTLPPGVHLVRATSSVAHPEGRAVELGDESVVVQFELRIDGERILGAPRAASGAPEPELVAAARAAGRALALLDAEPTPIGWRLSLRDLATERSSTAGPGASLERTVESLLDGLEPVIEEPPVVGGDDPWPWIGLGAGAAVVAAVAIGLAVGLTSGVDGFSASGTRWP